MTENSVGLSANRRDALRRLRLGNISTVAPSGGGRPVRAPRPRDIIARTQTPTAPGAAATAREPRE